MSRTGRTRRTRTAGEAVAAGTAMAGAAGSPADRPAALPAVAMAGAAGSPADRPAALPATAGAGALFAVGWQTGKGFLRIRRRRTERSIYARALYARPLTCLRNTEYGIRHLHASRPRCPVPLTYMLTRALDRSSRGPPSFDLGPTRPASRRGGKASRRARGVLQAGCTLRVSSEYARRSQRRRPRLLPPRRRWCCRLASPSPSPRQTPNPRRPPASLRRWCRWWCAQRTRRSSLLGWG